MIKLTKPVDTIAYIHEYANYDQKMEILREDYITSLGMNQYARYFDKLTGAVIVPDYIWNGNEKNKYRQLYENYKAAHGYKYILHANEGVILRGAATYYYLLANKGMYEQVNIEHIYSWMNSYNVFFERFLQEKLVIVTEIDKLCIMGILDCIRDYMINILNIYIYGIMEFDYSGSFIVFEKDDNDLVTILSFLRKVYIMFEQVMLSKNTTMIDNVYLYESIKKINTIIEEKKIKTDKQSYGFCLRSYRELDSFWELYITARYYNNINAKTNFLLGIMQGGAEIPIIISAINNAQNIEIGFIHLYGSFKDRHSKNAVKNSRLQTNLLPYTCTLCDENILTGNTLFIASKLLSNVGIQTNDYLVVRRIGSNRIFHVLAYNECIDIKYCQNNVHGMLFQTNYSKIKKNTNIKGMFYNELFQFDLSKERIYELLYINGYYSEKSRVVCYKNLETALMEKIRK